MNVLSPTRSLILDGPINAVSTDLKSTSKKKHKGAKVGYFYLFNDFFMFVRKKSSQKKHVLIPIAEALIRDPGGKQLSYKVIINNTHSENALEIIHVGRQIYIFISPTFHDKVFFMQKLEGLIEAHLNEACKRRSSADSNSNGFDYMSIMSASTPVVSTRTQQSNLFSNTNSKSKSGLKTSASSTNISSPADTKVYESLTMPKKRSSLKLGTLKLLGMKKDKSTSIINPDTFTPPEGIATPSK